MDWHDIRIILQIQRTGSFTGAARALGISKPTVGRRVRYLEQMTGMALFQRGPLGMTITEPARELLERAGPVDEMVRDIEQRVRALTSAQPRTITARMTDGVWRYLLAPVLWGHPLGPVGVAADRLHLRLPQMRPLPMETTEQADFSFIWASPGVVPAARGDELVARLADMIFVPYYSGRYGRERPVPAKFDDLARHRLVTMRLYDVFSTDGWREWDRVLGQVRGSPIVVDWSQSVSMLIADGAGIGLLTTFSRMYSDDVRRFDFPVPTMRASLWLASSKEAQADKQIRACGVTIRKLFREAEWMACG